MNFHEIRPRVWQIEEHYRIYCTLVQGETMAILWDTGLGGTPLRGFVEQSVCTPYRVLNSHGHRDHTGGDRAFPEAYLNRADWPDDPASLAPCVLRDLAPGSAFDLGGLHARVIPLTGHTRGSVGLLLEEERLLLAGDALNPMLFLGDPNAAPLPVLRRTMTQTLALPFDTFLASHQPNELPKRQVEAHLAHLEHLSVDSSAVRTLYGVPVVQSTWRGDGLRSVFYLPADPA